MKLPVFDLHCDTALALLGESHNEAGSLRKNNYHIDLERASKLDGYCQCFACFTTPQMQEWMGISPITVFERELASLQREFDQNKDLITLAYSTEDVLAAKEQGKASAILTIEGPAGFEYDPELLENLYQIGFRISTLGWNENSPLTGSHVTGGGLTEQGKSYVKTCQDLGILVDVSHISDEGFWDIMDMTGAPVVASHSNSRSVRNHSRNLTDEMFLEICRTGGLAGLNQCGDFIAERPDLNAACRHVLHFLELDPTGEHIALGGDLDGCGLYPDFTGVESYPTLGEALLTLGVTEDILKNIFWENPLRVFRSVEK